jgi:hypothetical protein
MRICIDLDSVNDTSRVLMAAADEYDRSAAALASGESLGGVTGPQRAWLLSAVQSVASRVRVVAARHREMAAELTRRACCAVDSASPVYAGIAVAGTQIAFDRDGDGINDTVAVDQDGDGFFEAFALDTQQDGIYDMVMIGDRSGNLLGAGFDSDQDGHLESFIGMQPSGAVWGSDPDRDGSYLFTPLVSGGASIVGGGFGTPSAAAGTTEISWSPGLLGPSIVGGGFGTYTTTISAPDWVLGSSIVGGYFHGDRITTFDSDSIISGAGIIGGASAGASGQTWLGGLMNLPGSPSLFDLPDTSSMFDTWMDDRGRYQPELGRADTYDWMEDPKLDSDGDGTFNAYDNHLTDYDRD